MSDQVDITYSRFGSGVYLEVLAANNHTSEIRYPQGSTKRVLVPDTPVFVR